MRLEPDVNFLLGIPGDVEPVGLISYALDPDRLAIFKRPVCQLIIGYGVAVVYNRPYGPRFAVGLAFPYHFLVFA